MYAFRLRRRKSSCAAMRMPRVMARGTSGSGGTRSLRTCGVLEDALAVVQLTQRIRLFVRSCLGACVWWNAGPVADLSAVAELVVRRVRRASSVAGPRAEGGVSQDRLRCGAAAGASAHGTASPQYCSVARQRVWPRRVAWRPQFALGLRRGRSRLVGAWANCREVAQRGVSAIVDWLHGKSSARSPAAAPRRRGIAWGFDGCRRPSRELTTVHGRSSPSCRPAPRRARRDAGHSRAAFHRRARVDAVSADDNAAGAWPERCEFQEGFDNTRRATNFTCRRPRGDRRPKRTCVAPAPRACSKSWLMPMDARDPQKRRARPRPRLDRSAAR